MMLLKENGLFNPFDFYVVDRSNDVEERFVSLGGLKENFIKKDIDKNNYLSILKILSEGDYLFDFSIDTKTLVLVEYCLNHGIHYLSTADGSWKDDKEWISCFDHYLVYRELRKKYKKGLNTCIVEFGMNPGLISCFVKECIHQVILNDQSLYIRIYRKKLLKLYEEKKYGLICKKIKVKEVQEVVPEDGALEYIASSCGGDLRKAMNAVEVLFSAGIPQDGKLPLTLADAKEVTQKSALRADRDGDNYYDLLSALHKSIRGSDPDAACHYLARLLEAGQMPSACRRLMCVAAEDVGLAYPQILPIVNACVDMALKLGMPEAGLPLADAAVLMATSPKSNSAYLAIDAALDDVRKGKSGDFPRHLQNVHADTYTMEREQGYLYPHNYPNHWVKQQYLPDELVGTHYYEYAENKLEQAAKQYWDKIKGEK